MGSAIAHPTCSSAPAHHLGRAARGDVPGGAPRGMWRGVCRRASVSDPYPLPPPGLARAQGAPSLAPSVGPTAVPSAAPTSAPTSSPTAVPTAVPTATPTAFPTATPSAAPTAMPSAAPTAAPSAVPTAGPTLFIISTSTMTTKLELSGVTDTTIVDLEVRVG